jgi:ATP-dependent Clp protease ATP-binding subunit ClpB
MTSNLGSEFLVNQPEGQDSDAVRDEVMGVVRHAFRPEFLNRIDEIVVFHGLDASHIEPIARIQLKRLAERLAQQDMRLEVTDAAIQELARAGYDPVFGARPLKRAIQQYVENPVARLILEGKFGPRDVVPVDWDGEQFVFERTLQ